MICTCMRGYGIYQKLTKLKKNEIKKKSSPQHISTYGIKKYQKLMNFFVMDQSYGEVYQIRPPGGIRIMSKYQK